MFKQQSFWSKDVNDTTNSISSRSASRRGTVFTNRTYIEHRKVSDIIIIIIIIIIMSRV
jgi:hypothetical protein